MLLFLQLSALPRRIKQLILLAADVILVNIALFCSLVLANGAISPWQVIVVFWPFWVLNGILKILVFYGFGLYQSVLKYTGSEFLGAILKALLVAELSVVAWAMVYPFPAFSLGFLLNDLACSFGLIVGVRVLGRRLVYPRPDQAKLEPIIIYGAGAAGFQLVQAFKHSQTLRVVALVDDSPQLQSHVVCGVRVYSPVLLSDLVEKYQVESVILAMPSVPKQRQTEILKSLACLSVRVQTVPAMEDLIAGKKALSQVNAISAEALLGRDEVLPDLELLQANVKDKVVMVTGAGGSIGSELCRQIAAQNPAMLVLYELNEFALYSIEIELRDHFPELPCIPCMGSVTDSALLRLTVEHHQVQTIYHAAAYKHVPLVEQNIEAAVLNNVYGTQVVAQTALSCRVEVCVLISTDKAVRPTSVMGTTKRIAELVVQATAGQSDSTRFSIVRFGNVLGSTGSVIPRFRHQIAAGQALTVTHPEITRYFMSIPEAARFVIQAGAMGKGGEVFLLDMGEPVKIYDLAQQMIRLCGLTPEVDLPINIIGLRPGEKLYEELLIDYATAGPTQHPKIFKADESVKDLASFMLYLELLLQAARVHDETAIMQYLQYLVPEYQSQDNRTAAIPYPG